jgi:hypothetical protein
MAQFDVNLPQIKKGYFMEWTVATQCWGAVTATLYDDSKTYFTVSKAYVRNGSLTLLQQSEAVCENTGTSLKLKVEFPNSTAVKVSDSPGAVTNQNLGTVGYVYSFCFEDSTDNDYNDLYVNIVGWKNKG